MLLDVHRVLQRMELSLDKIKCRSLEGTNAQEVRAMVLDMQPRLLLDMLGKGIASALINLSALVPEPWQASDETLSSTDPEAMAVDPALVLSIQKQATDWAYGLFRFCSTTKLHRSLEPKRKARNAEIGTQKTQPTKPTSAKVWTEEGNASQVSQGVTWSKRS
ncbi:hypothetical protein POM88_027986 [Heracleum sosnowskyi]|uniref:Uncharacterized protein n=1 Tax=Heracleum sosnowskyi TaxID=360622 RepID=A0AAD8MQF3_9APIA|nr:hypothetical protein POM88_027986 [Heracleum sosnowskyi]